MSDADRDADGAVDRDVDTFEAARPRLRGLAYRMLGVVADADDVVQDAWFRWEAADRRAIDNPDAWLTTVTSRLALDGLRRRKREEARYVGPWLPEPIVTDLGDPQSGTELADDLTLGFLTMLETLTPDERAAVLLADVFGEPFGRIAETLGRSEPAARQLASRGRRKLRGRDPHEPAVDASRAVVDRFLAALVAGDEAGALACLHPDVELVSDGGAERHAARRPVVGGERVARFMLNIAARADPSWSIEGASVGGLPGVVVTEPVGDRREPSVVIGFRVTVGKVTEIRAVLNRDKLTGVGATGEPMT